MAAAAAAGGGGDGGVAPLVVRTAEELAAVSGLGDCAAWITEEERGLASALLEAGQAHAFADWALGADVDAKHRFFTQVKGLESGYPGGIRAYTRRAQELLAASKRGDNPFAGFRPEVPTGVKLDFGSPDFCALEEIGLKDFVNSAFVLVAGGLGERLGYGGIKVSLPVEVTTGTTYLELYCRQILARQEQSNLVNHTEKTVPLAIMTSDDTHERTVALLRENAFFGMREEDVTILKQEKVAALVDNDAHIAMDDPYTINTKPHGHGDVHTLLYSSGVAQKWADEGRNHIVFFQDTNSLCFLVTIAAIGVSIKENYEVNSIAVPRKAKEAVGAITRLVRDDGSAITINVEYNQLEPMLLASGFKDGDVNDESGFSPFPGNINQLVFQVRPYVAALRRSHGLVPEFVNPKYADKTKTVFQKPTRLECMMQDHPRVLGPESRVGFTQFEEWTYSPVKNSLAEAAKKFADGVPLRCASEGELEFYASFARQLRMIGCHVADPHPWDITNFTLPKSAALVFAPDFASSFTGLKDKFPTPDKVRISNRSTLVVQGRGVVIESLELDGALVIKAAPEANVVVRDLHVRNGGWELTPLADGEDAPEFLRIRGYKLTKIEAREATFAEPGEFVLSA